MQPIDIASQLARDVASLSFGGRIAHVYNPLEYAWAPHKQYLKLFSASAPREVLLVGMNPGPWGMAQTGVPFGDVAMVRNWLGICAAVSQPRHPHPKRPVQGFACARSEVSGTRLWGWARDRFGTPEQFFARFFVHNYCPLCFMEAGGTNFTPDKLPAAEAAPLYKACDRALLEITKYLQPKYVIGVGGFAEARIREALAGERGIVTGRILHPSPASPAANRDWAGAAEKQLRELGVRIPEKSAAAGQIRPE